MDGAALTDAEFGGIWPSGLFYDAGRSGAELALLDLERVAAVLTDPDRRVHGLRFVRPLRFLPYEVRHAERADRSYAARHVVHVAAKADALLAGRLALLDHLYLNILASALRALHLVLPSVGI